uniref:Ovule protein n=1 Tax=Parascaris univalens TaxID=6257 RepID=A0A915C4R8_PARUN
STNVWIDFVGVHILVEEVDVQQLLQSLRILRIAEPPPSTLLLADTEINRLPLKIL